MTDVFSRKWSDDLEPIRQDRWILELDAVGIPAYVVKTAGRPKVTSEETEISFVNNTAYFKGKTKWDTIDITLLNPISPSSAKKVYEWLLLCHQQKEGIDGYKSEYAKNLKLKLLSPLNTTIESWTLHKAWPNNIDFGSLDMSSGEPVETTMTLRYDYATLDEVTTGE